MSDPFGVLRPLLVRIRPVLGETADTYICRLAGANHLKPSYLHCFIAGPRLWFGRLRLDRLAVLAGRTREDLQRCFTDPRLLLRSLDPLLDEGPKEVWARVIDQYHIVVPCTPLINHAKGRHASRVREPSVMPYQPSDFSRRLPTKERSRSFIGGHPVSSRCERTRRTA